MPNLDAAIVPLGEFTRFVGESLPKRYRLSVTVIQGASELRLVDPRGNIVIMPWVGSPEKAILNYINEARDDAGLSPVEWNMPRPS